MSYLSITIIANLLGLSSICEPTESGMEHDRNNYKGVE